MAITAGNIEARMTLDVSQFEAGVARAQASLDTVTQAARLESRRDSKFGQKAEPHRFKSKI